MKNIEIHNGRTLIQLPAQALLQTDASIIGWGPVWERVKTGVTWTQQERMMQINELELLALKLAIETFLRVPEIESLNIQMDNIVVLKMGSTKNLQMVCLSKQICDLLLRTRVPSQFTERHADICRSRRKTDSSEWKLPPMFQRLCVKTGKSLIDLFASRLYHQLPTYSVATNAFSITWNKEFYY